MSQHQQECFRYMNNEKNNYPIEEQAAEEVISLPMNPFVGTEEQNYIVSKIFD